MRPPNFQVQFSILDIAGVIAICLGLFKIRKLSWNHGSHSHTLDLCLLRFGLFFNYVFAAFTGAISIFPNPNCDSEDKYLHLVAAIASIVYCTINVVFIEMLLHKTVGKGKELHGRQVMSYLFLLLSNFYTPGCDLPDLAQLHGVVCVHVWSSEPNDNCPRVAILWALGLFGGLERVLHSASAAYILS